MEMLARCARGRGKQVTWLTAMTSVFRMTERQSSSMSRGSFPRISGDVNIAWALGEERGGGQSPTRRSTSADITHPGAKLGAVLGGRLASVAHSKHIIIVVSPRGGNWQRGGTVGLITLGPKQGRSSYHCRTSAAAANRGWKASHPCVECRPCLPNSQNCCSIRWHRRRRGFGGHSGSPRNGNMLT